MSKDRKTRDPFAPDLAKRLAPYDRTSAASRMITDSETELRAEKTARLRAIRLGEDYPGAPQADIPSNEKI
ncbi:MAG: hypothetical protein PF443_05400 [Allgaiera sp.]|nr:hypothetical protein [Allgaiera sp.]